MKEMILISILSILFTSNCAGVKETCNDVEVKVLEINSWLNLMPGGPGSFHLSGEFSLFHENEEVECEISIVKIQVYYNDELIYSFKPLIQYSRTEQKSNQLNRLTEVFQFFTETGLEIREPMMAAEFIDVELLFEIDDKNVFERINEVELTRAY